MPLTGVNKFCAQCIKECKQWAQIKIIRCPFFKSKQSRFGKAKDGHTLYAQQSQLEARREAIFGN